MCAALSTVGQGMRPTLALGVAALGGAALLALSVWRRSRGRVQKHLRWVRAARFRSLHAEMQVAVTLAVKCGEVHEAFLLSPLDLTPSHQPLASTPRINPSLRRRCSPSPRRRVKPR